MGILRTERKEMVRWNLLCLFDHFDSGLRTTFWLSSNLKYLTYDKANDINVIDDYFVCDVDIDNLVLM